MLIVADLGNTTVHIGLCQGGEIVRTDRFPVEEISKGKGPSGLFGLEAGAAREVVLATVNPGVAPSFRRWCQEVLGRTPLEIGPDIPLSIDLQVDRPEEVGVDRALNALSVFERHRSAAIVVDFGTAVTLDAVSLEGAYLGGAIAPGLGLGARALWNRAALIPPIEITPTDDPIGRNTEAAMRIGFVQGYIGLVDRLVLRMKPALGGSPRVVATGGEAALIAGGSEQIEETVPNLTLDGIRIAYERDREGGGSRG